MGDDFFFFGKPDIKGLEEIVFEQFNPQIGLHFQGQRSPLFFHRFLSGDLEINPTTGPNTKRLKKSARKDSLSPKQTGLRPDQKKDRPTLLRTVPGMGLLSFQKLLQGLLIMKGTISCGQGQITGVQDRIGRPGRRAVKILTTEGKDFLIQSLDF